MELIRLICVENKMNKALFYNFARLLRYPAYQSSRLGKFQHKSNYFSSTTISKDFNRNSHRQRQVFVNKAYKVRPCDILCAKLSNEHESVRLKPSELAMFPLMCFNAKRTEYFNSSTVVRLWWTALEKNLNHLDCRCITDALRGLGKLNLATNGKVEQHLGWKQILTLVETILKLFSEHRDMTMSIMLQTLKRWNRGTMTTDETESLNVLLSSALNNFIDLHIADANSKIFAYPQHGSNTGQTFFRFTEFVADPPSDERILKILHAYSKDFGSHRTVAEFSCIYIQDLDALGQAFLNWKINANHFDDKFWSGWYNEMMKHFPYLRQNYEGRAIFLRTCLQLAIEFDQEAEFSKMKFLWIDHLRLIRERFSKDDAEMLINKMKLKYFSKPDSDDEFGFKPVLTLLESV